MVRSNTSFQWVVDFKSVDALSEFFVRNVTPDYISHGEILSDRATDAETWSPNLRTVMSKELIGCIASFRRGDGLRLAVAVQDKNVIALSIAEIEKSAESTHGWIHDLVVERELRSEGVGRDFLEWIEQEFRAKNVRSIFIETGIRNKGAHTFFELHGYVPGSLIMRKVL